MEGRDEFVIDTRSCTNLNEEIDSLIKDGYRLDMIMPADAPREALLSRNSHQLRLTTNPKSQPPNPESEGRAGMQYRDLIPGRLNGKLIASHIKIIEGGPVPDYVHYHKIHFQLIYCKRGTIRVVYEDQGPPFELNPGDCVLQPSEIRHRVLEATAGAEVIEISSPAEHETWIDHEMSLPTEDTDPVRMFNGQKFVRSLATGATWHSHGHVSYRDTSIGDGCAGFADLRIARFHAGGPPTRIGPRSDLFVFCLSGAVEVSDAEKTSRLPEGDSILLPAGRPSSIKALSEAEVLEVALHGL